MTPRRIHLALLLAAAAVLVWSGISPNGRFNWIMETFPAIVGSAILVATYRRFPFTTLTYVLVTIFAIILMIGGHYTYAEVPLGNWARDAVGFSRNHFDRLGHLFQGVVPAMLARELLRRKVGVRSSGWLFALAVSVALAISALYELFEWRFAVTFGGKQAEDFLGSQGDVWDAQKDMAMALAGSAGAVALLSRWQDRQSSRERSDEE